MISLIQRIRTKGTEDNRRGYGLIVIEELLFWGGLGALAFGSEWIAIFGGVAVCVSIVLVIFLFVYH